MALTGIEIYKRLPKTNCKKCGMPTCLAFAMALAGKKASLDQCPDISAEGKAELDGASAPPIRLVEVGKGEEKIETGNETVLFRHEQTFYHPTAIGYSISDALPEIEFQKKLALIDAIKLERVGQKIKVEVVAVINESGDAGKFSACAKMAGDKATLAVVLVSSKKECVESALKAMGDAKPLICSADSSNVQDFSALAKQYGCPLAVGGDTVDEIAELTPKVKSAGVEDIVLTLPKKSIKENLSGLIQIRRLALKKTFRPLGYPVIAFTQSDDPKMEILEAATYIAKYAGIVVLKDVENWKSLQLMALRQNVFTDPRVPIQVEPKAYEIGKVSDVSPVLVTTNFSLTYFTVEGEVEASKIPAYIIVVDTEGMSVLTAFAADKLTEVNITSALKKSGIEGKVKHRKLLIPGYVSALSGKLEEASGWKILVGPREASAISNYLKNVWKPE